jgi:hypothetical protein
MSKMPALYETPPADAFRAWLQGALVVIEMKPATVSREIGASVNSVGAFLRDPARDITLSRAAQLERYLRRVAKAKGVDLPAISRPAIIVPGVAHG